MYQFSALGRRGLIRGSAATTLGAVALPAPGRAEAVVPQPLATNLVTASPRHWNGRDCLSLELTDDEQAGRLDRTRSGNGPSFAIVNREFGDGTIEADIGAELTGKGAPDDRGFAGLSFHFEVSREAFPGRYEKGADIAIGRWHRLRLEVQGRHLRVLVDGVEVLAVDDLHYAGRRGPVGLFVGDGSCGLFTNLSVFAA
jgi:hypothetical protein